MQSSSEYIRSRLLIWRLLIVIKRKGEASAYDVYRGDCKEKTFASPTSYYKKLREAEQLGLVENISNSRKAVYRLTLKGIEDVKLAEKLFGIVS